jgi:hypothetical protein
MNVQVSMMLPLVSPPSNAFSGLSAWVHVASSQQLSYPLGLPSLSTTASSTELRMVEQRGHRPQAAGHASRAMMPSRTSRCMQRSFASLLTQKQPLSLSKSLIHDVLSQQASHWTETSFVVTEAGKFPVPGSRLSHKGFRAALPG